MRALLLTALAVTAFAANSLLCRLALQDKGMDPVAFTVIRMVSAALALAVLLRLRSGSFRATAAGSWLSAVWLFGYAIAFSLAYVGLPTGIGALLLFGSATSLDMLILNWRFARWVSVRRRVS